MSEQSRIAFEKSIATWYESADMRWNDITESYDAYGTQCCWDGWQAATLESAERIAALEGEVAELTRDRDEWKDSTITANRRFEIAEQSSRELQANNHDLREAIRKIEFEYDYCSDADMTNAVKEAMTLISATPAESLQAFENSVIEKCAKVCEDDAQQSRLFGEPMQSNVAEAIAESLRALKQEVK